jgi:GDP-L-fucose synthase
VLLITGASGFLGSHIADECSLLNPLIPSRNELDLLDLESVKSFFEKHDITQVIHAAGYVGGIELHVNHPAEVAIQNLKMGSNIIEASALKGKVRLINIATVCIYPENAEIPINEKFVHDGYPAKETAYYGIIKKTLHVLALAMSKEHGLSFATVVPTNLYGPGDTYDENKSHVVSALIRRVHEAKLLRKKNITVWGDGSQSRDLLYVKDCAKWIVKLLQTDISDSLINFGSGVETNIKELAKNIFKIVGYDGEIFWDTSKPAGANRRLLDISYAEKILQYKPDTDLLTGLHSAYIDYQNRSIS